LTIASKYLIPARVQFRVLQAIMLRDLYPSSSCVRAFMKLIDGPVRAALIFAESRGTESERFCVIRATDPCANCAIFTKRETEAVS
jgi:hypothetical protein